MGLSVSVMRVCFSVSQVDFFFTQVGPSATLVVRNYVDADDTRINLQYVAIELYIFGIHAPEYFTTKEVKIYRYSLTPHSRLRILELSCLFSMINLR